MPRKKVLLRSLFTIKNKSHWSSVVRQEKTIRLSRFQMDIKLCMLMELIARMARLSACSDLPFGTIESSLRAEQKQTKRDHAVTVWLKNIEKTSEPQRQ